MKRSRFATLPGDYATVPPASVPRLGTPLPGDLGGPIVRAQQEGRMEPGVAAGPVSLQTPSPAEAGAALSTLLGVAAELAAPQNRGSDGRIHHRRA